MTAEELRRRIAEARSLFERLPDSAENLEVVEAWLDETLRLFDERIAELRGKVPDLAGIARQLDNLAAELRAALETKREPTGSQGPTFH